MKKNLFKQFDLIESFTLFEVTGEDRVRFLQGQLTNDIEKLEEGNFQLQARLDRNGRLVSYFYLLKDESRLYGLIPCELYESFLEDINRFIIMDDVEITKAAYQRAIVQWPITDTVKGFKGIFANVPASIILENEDKNGYSFLSGEDFKECLLLGGEPVLGITATVGQLVTDTILNLRSVSLSKGCFLGQETVSKIETRRGGAYFPLVLESRSPIKSFDKETPILFEGKSIGKVLDVLDDQITIIASIIRNYRVVGKELEVSINDSNYIVEVQYLPRGGERDLESCVEEMYELAVGEFQSDRAEEAVEIFKSVVALDPKHEDSYEAIGVILGRQEKFIEGITFMDKVLDANPDSVMAHTNKSLFYMRLGEIEKAEEEKAQATVKSFQSFGKEAEKKKQIEEQQKRDEEELERRLGMFKQVLEIDPEDNLANYGMADIYFKRERFEDCVPLLEKVLEVDKKYSVAYLLLGKVFLKLDSREKARDVFMRGIEVASSQGDLMPANEMQSKLSELC